MSEGVNRQGFWSEWLFNSTTTYLVWCHLRRLRTCCWYLVVLNRPRLHAQGLRAGGVDEEGQEVELSTKFREFPPFGESNCWKCLLVSAFTFQIKHALVSRSILRMWKLSRNFVDSSARRSAAWRHSSTTNPWSARAMVWSRGGTGRYWATQSVASVCVIVPIQHMPWILWSHYHSRTS